MRRLIQVHGEGRDLSSPLAFDCDTTGGSLEIKMADGDTPLHFAIAALADAVQHHRPTSIPLAIVQFILQNVSSAV